MKWLFLIRYCTRYSNVICHVGSPDKSKKKSNAIKISKIIITEVGITIETDIPSIDLVRGSYNLDLSDEVSNGRFVCDITKGFGEFFSLSLNTDNGVGAFTSMGGSTRTTTTFKIE